MLDIDPRTDEELRWLDEKREIDSDPDYVQWLMEVERKLDEELGEDNG